MVCLPLHRELPFNVVCLGGAVGFCVTEGFSGFLGIEGLGFLATAGGLQDIEEKF